MADKDVASALADIAEADDMVPIDQIGPAEMDLVSDRSALYTKTKYLRKRNGKVYGTWRSSFTSACNAPNLPSYIEEEAVDSLTRIGNCSDNDSITKCQRK